MKFYEYFPLILYFVVYFMGMKLIAWTQAAFAYLGLPPYEAAFAWLSAQDPFMMATAVFIPASLVTLVLARLSTGKISTLHWVTFIIVVLLGIPTLLFNNKALFMWKVTVVNWLFALAYLYSVYCMRQPIMQRMMGSQVTLSTPVWKKLTLIWAVFFAVLGGINLYVAYQLSEAIWVQFKVFGVLGISVLFIIIQSGYLFYHLKREGTTITDTAE